MRRSVVSSILLLLTLAAPAVASAQDAPRSPEATPITVTQADAKLAALKLPCTAYNLTKHTPTSTTLDSASLARSCAGPILLAVTAKRQRADSIAAVKAFEATRPAGYTGTCWRFNVVPDGLHDICITETRRKDVTRRYAVSAVIDGKWVNDAGGVSHDSSDGPPSKTVVLRDQTGALLPPVTIGVQ